MRQLKSSRILALVASGYSLVALIPTPVHAAWGGACVGSGESADVPTLKGFACLFAQVLPIIFTLIGLAMFIMLLWGGFRYLTSGGDPKAIDGAKSTLTMALAGIVMALGAWFVLTLIQTITGVKLTDFFVGLSETP